MELREVFNESKPHVFFVTHSITEALWLADRVLLLKGQPGSPILDERLPWGPKRDLQVRASDDFQNRVEKCFGLLRGAE
jgi:NitT/TauT family transport system ATP-binding protein